jgi:PAS domain S-box-containing protein
MTIRLTTWITVGLTCVVLSTALILTARVVTLNGYRDLEQTTALRNLQRVQNALEGELARLDILDDDYATWDESYRFVKTPFRSYRNDNLSPSSFENLKINSMLFFDTAGGLVEAPCYSLLTNDPMPLPSGFLRAITTHPGLQRLAATPNGIHGLIIADSQAVMVAAQPILRTDMGGPAAGTLVLARLLDSAEVRHLSEITEIGTAIFTCTSPHLPSDAAAMLTQLQASGSRQSKTMGDSCTYAYTVLNDLFGKPAILLRTATDREIFRHGQRTFSYACAALLLITGVFILLIFFILEAKVLARIRWLARGVSKVRKAATLSERIAIRKHDELSGLAQEINDMLASIQGYHARLTASERRYAVLFKEMLNAIALYETVRDGAGLSIDVRFLDVNPAFERLTGLSREKVIGKTLGQVQPSLEPDRLQRYLEVIESGKSSFFEAYNQQLNKHFEIMAFIAAPDQLAVSFTDISERCQAEAEKEKMQTQVLESQKMEAIGQLAGGIAHDFNNQMAAILGYAEILQHKLGTDPQYAFYLRNILKGIHHSADLTRQLLAFARKGKYLCIPVNLHALIGEVVVLVTHAIDKRICIRQELQCRNPFSMGDPTQLQNMLLNLVLNARDAMPRGGTLSLATRDVELDEEFCLNNSFEITPGAYLQISVCDTGVGISLDIMKHIFEPFFTTKELGKGTGMGLASVWGTVQNHHGAITVDSEVGTGSTFTIYLPHAADTSVQDAEVMLIGKIPGTPHVLVVDDEQIIQDVAKVLLNEMGCRSSFCHNGHDAVAFYHDNFTEVDVVLLDLMMPQLSGYDTFFMLREINPAVKVIVSSGYSLDGEAAKILSAGAKSFIQKPYRGALLYEELIKVLGES